MKDRESTGKIISRIGEEDEDYEFQRVLTRNMLRDFIRRMYIPIPFLGSLSFLTQILSFFLGLYGHVRVINPFTSIQI